MAYLPTGLSEEIELEELDLVRVYRSETIAIAQQRLKLAKRAALFDGIRMAVVVAVPVAAFFGLQRYFQWKKEEES